MKYKIGDIIDTHFKGRAGEDGMRVIGRVEAVALTIRDGSGHERTIRAGHDFEVQIASFEAERHYWRDRALTAERDGHGTVPGKTATPSTRREESANVQWAVNQAVTNARIANRARQSMDNGYFVLIEQNGDRTSLTSSGDAVATTKLPPGRYVFLPTQE